MATQKIHLSAQKQAWTDQFKPDALKGDVLNPNAKIQADFERDVQKLTDAMVKVTTQEITKLFSSEVARDSHVMDVMDASISSQARIIMNRLMDRFTSVFSKVAKPMCEQMVGKTAKNTATTTKLSLKKAAGNITINTSSMSAKTKDILKASVSESVGLIKRIPERYLGSIQNAVMRSITSGKGLKDLVPELDKQNIEIKNWSKNTALDQTRKVYNNLSRSRLKTAGVQKFEWIHSSGSSHPRSYHLEKYPTGLNGGVFSFDDPPVIDKRTGQTGFPGDLPNCRCRMRPVIEVNDASDDSTN